MKSKLVRFIIALVLVYGAAAIGSIVTFPAIPNWYASLDSPSFTPPNSLFGPVWTVLYTLMGISLYLVWNREDATRPKRAAYVAFGGQLVLNVLWSITFFGLQQLWLSVVVIAALWVAIVITMLLFWPFSRKATYLLAPYLVWVTFALALNIGFALLNA